MIKKNEIFTALTAFILVSTIILSISLFIYVAYNDYILYELYEVGVGLDADGYLAEGFLELMDDIPDLWVIIPQALDYMWLTAFITMVMNVFAQSYFTKRQGYLTILSYVNYGVMFVLFLMTIVYTVAEWVYDIFINGLLQNATFVIPFFSYYLENYIVINLVILAVALYLNIADFDLTKYTKQKEREQNLINDEI